MVYISSITGGLIRSSVGNNLFNKQDDVTSVKRALSALGRFEEDEPNGYITRELDGSIRKFQKDNGLETDGLLYPGGETETALLQNLRQRGEERIKGYRRAIARSQSSYAGEEEEPEPELDPVPPVPEPKPEPPPETDPPEEEEPVRPVPPVPPPKPPGDDRNPDKPPQEKDCSGLEFSYEMALREAEQAEIALDAARASLDALQNELDSINDSLEREKEQNTKSRIAGGAAGAATGAIIGGVIGGGIPGAIAGVIRGFPAGGSIGSGIEWVDDIVPGTSNSALEAKREEVEKMIAELESSIASELEPAMEEAQRMAAEAEQRLSECQNKH